MEKGTEAEFVAVALAYHVLSNAKLRAQYDANELEFANARALLVDTFDMPKVSNPSDPSAHLGYFRHDHGSP